MYSRSVLALLEWTAFSCLVPAFFNTGSECKQRYPQTDPACEVQRALNKPDVDIRRKAPHTAAGGEVGWSAANGGNSEVSFL